MSLYRRLDTGEIRDLDPARVAALPPNKQAMWEAYTPPPPPPPAPVFVSKDVVVRRIREKGKLGAMRTMVAGLPADDQFEFAHLTMLNPADTRLRNRITQLGENPDEILAP